MQIQLKLVAVAAAAAFAGTVSAQDLVVKIGHVGPTSGGIAHLGKDNENGARMAIDELNAKGVTIPVAVKLSPFFSNFANMAKRLDIVGANGLVLFNRFYQPDIDLECLGGC